MSKIMYVHLIKGPNDLSTTIWYDRDNALHFAFYFFRFYFLIALELPLYFIRNRKVYHSNTVRMGRKDILWRSRNFNLLLLILLHLL
jgi:hypothetical protein